MGACRALLLGAGLLLCALNDGTLAVSLRGDLCNNISVSAIDCDVDPFSIQYPDHHAICSQQTFSGTTVTLWQLFTLSLPLDSECNSTTDSSSCTELGLSSEWHRVLPLENHNQSLTCSFERTQTSCEVAANASLTLHDIKKGPDDDPEYTVSLTLEGCPGQSPVKRGHFSLGISGPMCIVDIPAPTETQIHYTFYEAAMCPRMNVTFIGGVPDNVFTFQWNNSRDERVCHTAGQTLKMGRYTCGWITNDRDTCNSTIWLSITNCTMADSGNYSIVGIKSTDGPVAHVLLSFYSTEDKDSSGLGTRDTIAVTSVSVLFLLAAIGATVGIVLYVCICRPKTVTTSTNISIKTSQHEVGTVVQVTESVEVGPNVEADFSSAQSPRLWKRMRNPRQKLNRDDLLTVSQKVVHWQALARKLGISEPDIATIEADYSHDYNEQKFQSLLKWFQGKGSPPTRQSLIRVIEVKLQDPQLARDVENSLAVMDNQLSESGKPRAYSMLS